MDNDETIRTGDLVIIIKNIDGPNFDWTVGMISTVLEGPFDDWCILNGRINFRTNNYELDILSPEGYHLLVHRTEIKKIKPLDELIEEEETHKEPTPC